ncbi:hypothetical protein OS175_13435 [Marinicella sp. S1101]|uniref:WD40/YVTN/BNR-like repeat-containing protein n=1 Tax=Marinicella marina TaxID=2996016 RepID=UPI002260860D|nr:hypothetical protein [Marinicella marina]MCX7554877.1 hypothetical protein [Marinicella marina]MDJ1141535.1 hypothetical protein [Marinicella marina]
MLKIRFALILLITIGLVPIPSLFAKTAHKEAISKAVSGLELRGIGPAFMGGRIADIAVSPTDQSTWYVAVGSGGLWKTTNRGTTWTPIFDSQKSYSIGTVSIDPNNSDVIWVGTGENVSGRHVAWGDGVYKSKDGGQTWRQMGLEKSEHIGRILIDPRNSDVVFVAAEGPLWSAGGERGLYKTEDGGETWSLVLEINKNTGVTDIEFDPSNPDVMYAAAYQRRRMTWSFLAGGPDSGIYKSTDNGVTWSQVTTGLPKGDVGKIGLAVTPADPDLVYATIEANDQEKGLYRSLNKGESWEKRNSYTSGGTGPHYYQEIEVSPQDPDLIYQLDVFYHVSRDGGKTFNYLGTGREKHSDNHALWINPKDGRHLISGTDGGLYESFDEGSTWRHFPNLPIAQFYKLDVDNAEPFYNIVGGTQDLGSLHGPSRTMNTEGVRNQDWYVPLGADGSDAVFDPKDPNIAYLQIQQGTLHRVDRRTNEVIFIQPQPETGEIPERWNWDSPIEVSPHNNQRIYFGSQRVWQSDDQGNSWTPISGDLTTNTNRYQLETMDKRVWSVDSLYDNGAMSKYATLTAIDESPQEQGLIYTGSDDGLIHVSEDGGKSWKASELPKIPKRAFINDVEASKHDTDEVFAVADAHKFGDFKPYLFMSDNRGRSWRSIAGDLPEDTIVWVIKQDHIDENLLFIGTEFGIYFSPNKGDNWIKLAAGVPTISFRDIEIQTRDSDLVGATFGRGFYVLDDYSPLRHLSQALKDQANVLFPVRDAWWYVPNVPMQAKGMPGQGTTSFAAENPPFGAVFTYYLNEIPQTAKSQRQDTEKALRKDNADVPFPGWQELAEEAKENKPQVLFLVSDAEGQAVRWLKGSSKKGLHRINWDLKLPAPNPINFSQPAFKPPWVGDPEGPLAAPGNYNVQLFIAHDGKLESQGEAQAFMVKPVANNIATADYMAATAFQAKTSELSRQASSAGRKLGEAGNRIKHMKAALLETPKASKELFADLQQLEQGLAELRQQLNGDPVRQGLDESTSPAIRSRIGYVAYGHWGTTQKPTQTQQKNIAIAESGLQQFRIDLSSYLKKLEAVEAAMEAAAAPYTPGRKLE